MAVKIQLRRDLATNWTSANPILAQGEMGVELDTSKFKLGNGVDAWSVRPYGGLVGSSGADGADGVGIPIGGTANQVLTKIDSVNYNTQWSSFSASLVSFIPLVVANWIGSITSVYEALNELARRVFGNADDYQKISDDFMGNGYNGSVASYHLGWSCDRTGTNSVSGPTSIIIGPTVKGVHLLSTGTTATGRAYLYLYSAAIVFGGYVWDQEWKIRPLNISDVTQAYYFNCGFFDTPTAAGLDCVDGVYIQHDETTPNYVIVCSKGSVRDKFNSGIPVDTADFHRVRIKINKAGTNVSFYYDDVLVNTYSSSNIPVLNANATGVGALMVKTAGTTSRAIYIDTFSQENYT